MASGYWQVEMDPADREKTALRHPLACMSLIGCPLAYAMPLPPSNR